MTTPNPSIPSNSSNPDRAQLAALADDEAPGLPLGIDTPEDLAALARVSIRALGDEILRRRALRSP